MQAKHIIGDFEGFFEGAETFFDPQIVLSVAKGNFGVKKVGRFNLVPKLLKYSCLDSSIVRALLDNQRIPDVF